MNYEERVTITSTQTTWTPVVETRFPVNRYSPDAIPGKDCVTGTVTSGMAKRWAGNGQVHGRPYFAKYVGQTLAQSPQMPL